MKEKVLGAYLVLDQLLLPMGAYRLRGRGLLLVARGGRVVAEGILVVVVLHGRHVGMLHDSTVGVHSVTGRGRRGLALGIDAHAEVLSVPGVNVCLVMMGRQLLGHSR